MFTSLLRLFHLQVIPNMPDNAKLAASTAALAAATGQISALHSQISTLTGEVSAAQTAQSAAEADKATAVAAQQAAESKAADLQTQLDALPDAATVQAAITTEDAATTALNATPAPVA